MTQFVHAVVQHRFAVPAERVYDAWLDPEWIGCWMFASGLREERIVRLAVEPRVGGKFSFVVDRQGEIIDHIGEYLEVDRPGLLVFTWATRGARPDASRVVVEIVPCAGGCELTVTHVLEARWARLTDQVAGSWRALLAALAGALAASTPLTLNPS